MKKWICFLVMCSVLFSLSQKIYAANNCASGATVSLSNEPNDNFIYVGSGSITFTASGTPTGGDYSWDSPLTGSAGLSKSSGGGTSTTLTTETADTLGTCIANCTYTKGDCSASEQTTVTVYDFTFGSINVDTNDTGYSVTMTWSYPSGASPSASAAVTSGSGNIVANPLDFTDDTATLAFYLQSSNEQNNAHVTITVDGTITAYSQQIDVNKPDNGSVGPIEPSWAESTLSHGRKISLSGYPMPDQKPSNESESDYEPENTYIDAFNLDLRHDVTDVFVPFGSDHLSLEVRRSIMQETYPTYDSAEGLAMYKPFGPCWSSAISPGYVFDRSEHLKGKFTITDHQGQTYVFYRYTWVPLGGTEVEEGFYPKPLSTAGLKSLAGVSLTRDPNGSMRLTLANGTTCVYDVNHAKYINYQGGSNRQSVIGLGSFQNYYHNIHTVTDRAGHQLTYHYEGASDWIPSRIESSSGQEITITTVTGTPSLIKEIKDPRDNVISYVYTEGKLTSVERTLDSTETSITRYEYEEYTELDNRSDMDMYGTYAPSPLRDYKHITLKKITDANENTYSFKWEDTQRYDYKYMPQVASYSNRMIRVGQPRYVSAITNVANDVVSFSDLSSTNNGGSGLSLIDSGDSSDFYQIEWNLNEDRKTRVSCSWDPTNEWIYHFSDYNVSRPKKTKMASVRDQVLFEYRSLVISNVLTGMTESYYSDMVSTNQTYSNLKPMMLVASTNASSQVKRYEYAYSNPTDANANYRPSKEINALDGEKIFHYREDTLGRGHQLSSQVDELGRETVFGFDAYGNRTSAIVYATTNRNVTLSTTLMEYNDDSVTNFMTKQTVVNLDEELIEWASDLVTVFTAHEFGKVATKIIDPNDLALTTVYDYDANNNLTYVKDPNGNVTANRYDALNRLKEIAFFDGSDTNVAPKCTKEFWYDLRSNKSWEKDENDHYTFFQYDKFNNVTNTVRIMNESFMGPTNGLAVYNTPYYVDDIQVSSTYNAAGMLETTTDARELVTKFFYDDLRRLTNSVVGFNLDAADQLSTTYSYAGDNSGAITLPPYKFSPTSVTDPRNYATETDYDALNRPIETRAQVTNSIDAVTINTYDAVGNLTVVSNLVSTVGGNVWQDTVTDFDDLNRPYKITFSDSTTNGIFYTSTGLKWKTADTLGRFSTVEYDSAGRPVKTKSPEITTGVYAETETGYDANGNVKWIKDANDNISTNVYDYRNRVVETIAPVVLDGIEMSNASPIVSMIYDPVGNVKSVTDAEGNTTTNFYDANNRLYETWAPEVYTNGVAVRPKTVNQYDDGGNIRYTTDANEKVVEMQYDAFGRLTNTVDAITNSISFAYDANGNQTHLTDGEGNTTEFRYDGLNRKTHTIYPEVDNVSAVEIAEYDLLGNRTKRIDCNEVETDYAYDLGNRLDLVTYPGNRTRDYHYDEVGNLTNVVESANAKADVSYTYDNLNRVSSETSVGITHHYKYDLNGNRTNAIYGISGREVNWDYDALNRIEQITEQDPAITPEALRTTTYRYDLNSKPVYREYPSGVEEMRTFDPMGRLLTMTTTNMAANAWFSMAYEYDAVGSALEMVQASSGLTEQAQDATTTWGYDDRYRLKRETINMVGGETTRTEYTWDDADNRNTKKIYNIVGQTDTLVCDIEYEFNVLNQLVSWADYEGWEVIESSSYYYDANGCRTNKVGHTWITDAAVEYEYDEDNRLIKVIERVTDHPNCNPEITDCVCDDCGLVRHEQPNQTTGLCDECGESIGDKIHNFEYDYRSRRYYRGTPAATGSTNHMYSVFDGGLVVQEYEPIWKTMPRPDLAIKTEFVRGEGMGGGVGGMVYSIKDSGTTNETIIVSHANHRGDVIARSNLSGSLTSFALYEAYGTRPYNWGSDPDRQKANTKEEESDLNLLNEGMRFRDLETGVFLTRDPIGYGDGPNVYCYVHCNPITKFDALGLDALIISGGINENLRADPNHDNNPMNFLHSAGSQIESMRESGYTESIDWVVNFDSMQRRQDNKPFLGGWMISGGAPKKDRIDYAKAVKYVNDLAEKHGVNVISCSSKDEFIKAHNQAADGSDRKDGSLDTWRYYGHGNSSYFLINPTTGGNVHKEDLTKINGSIFDKDSDIKSYGCNHGTENDSGSVIEIMSYLWGDATGMSGRVDYGPVANGAVPMPGTHSHDGTSSSWETEEAIEVPEFNYEEYDDYDYDSSST